MPLLVKDDLKSHLYAEIITEITRGNDTLVTRAISAAVSEAKSYLSRFDLLALFGNADTEPTVQDENLKNKCLDLACWHLVKLSNPNINIELFRTGYEDAIKFLEKVMKGQADPDGWPYKPDDPETEVNENAAVQWSSNHKRNNHF